MVRLEALSSQQLRYTKGMEQVKRATLQDLMKEPDKAELVNGVIVRMAATGFLPGFAAAEVLDKLRGYAREHKKGYALGDNVGFKANLPHQNSKLLEAVFRVTKVALPIPTPMSLGIRSGQQLMSASP